jgi:hypothetical protein
MTGLQRTGRKEASGRASIRVTPSKTAIPGRTVHGAALVWRGAGQIDTLAASVQENRDLQRRV